MAATINPIRNVKASGRLIQRPWDATFDEYLLYRMKDQDANRPHNATDLKRTEAGRPVYSGGGIEPDKRVDGPIEGFNPTRFGRMLYARGEFANYAQKYSAEGDTRVTQQATGRRVVKPNFVVDDAMLADFRDQLRGDKVKIDDDGMKKEMDRLIKEAKQEFIAQRQAVGAKAS